MNVGRVSVSRIVSCVCAGPSLLLAAKHCPQVVRYVFDCGCNHQHANARRVWVAVQVMWQLRRLTRRNSTRLLLSSWPKRLALKLETTNDIGDLPARCGGISMRVVHPSLRLRGRSVLVKSALIRPLLETSQTQATLTAKRQQQREEPRTG